GIDLPWFRERVSKIYYAPPPGTSREAFLKYSSLFKNEPVLPKVDYATTWSILPIVDMMKVVGGPPTDYEDWVSHAPGDPWWEPFGFVTGKHRFDVPALHIDSWYEIAVKETFFHFNLFRTNAESARGRDNQYIIISPTTHCLSEFTTDHTIVGARDLG